MSLPDRLQVVLEDAAGNLPGDVGRRLLSFASKESLATMAAVVTIWAGAHFFGAGEVADVILLVVGYIALGGSALQAGRKLIDFAIETKRATTEEDLAKAGKALSDAISIIGVDGTLALLFRAKPKDTFGTVFKPERPIEPYSSFRLRDLPRNGGWYYKPTIRFTKQRLAGEGGTTPTGDIVIGRDFYPGGRPNIAAEAFAQVRKAVIHEQVHQFLAAKFYILREPRMYMHMSAYKRSFILRYLEEAVAETIANLVTQGVGKDQLFAGLKFPFGNKYQINIVQLGEEAHGILLGPITVAGLIYQAYYGLEDE